MKPAITRMAVALSACLTFVAAHEGATARDRDHGGGGAMVRDHREQPIVRDHREPVIVRDHREPVVVRDHREQPIVRDHREPVVVRDHRTQPIVRDHRTTPIVRDHGVPRGPQGGVTVTSSGSRRGGSPCIRSVFGGPCFGL
jgi:hypothetical protein